MIPIYVVVTGFRIKFGTHYEQSSAPARVLSKKEDFLKLMTVVISSQDIFMINIRELSFLLSGVATVLIRTVHCFCGLKYRTVVLREEI
jgi:hypothetical protein